MTRAAVCRVRCGRRGLLGVLAIVVLLVLGPAAPASAHASLVGSDPAEGTVLDAAPDTIGLVFNETVLGVPDGVRVFDAQGEPVASDSSVSGHELDVELTGEVGDGTLVVVWRVLSEDGHPISGSLSFSIGAASTSVVRPPTESSGSTDVPATLSAVRAVGYVGLFLAGGLVAFVVVCAPAALSPRGRRRLVVGARVGAAAAVGAWLLGLPLTAVYQLGGGLGSLTDAGTWSTLPATEYVVAAVVVLGVVGAAVLLGAGTPDRGRGRLALLAAGLAVAAPALTGHTRATAPEALVVGADVLHLLAGSVWLGGLVGLALVLRELSVRGNGAGEVLARFSGLAAGVLAALVVAGVVLGWRIVGSWSALVETTYGTLLLVKVAVALVAVLIATWNRFALLPRLRRATRRRDIQGGARLVARSTAAEAGVLVVALLLTGVLVDKSPEADRTSDLAAAAAEGPQRAQLADITVLASMAPRTLGPNTVTLELRDSAGAPAELFEPPRLSLASDGIDLGNVPLTRVVAGTYTAEAVLPTSGTWRLQVSLRIGEFENPVATVELEVP